MTTPNLHNWMWQSTLCLAACWLFYYVLLRRESCFGYNRGYLLLTPVLAGLAPLLPWAQWWPVAAAVRTVGVPYAVLPALRISADGGTAPTASSLVAVYAAGVGLALLHMGWQLWRLRRLTRSLPMQPQPGYTLRPTGGFLPTSSFGRTVFWDDSAPLTAAEAAQVLAHELAHVRQGHTADRLWLQLCRAVLWFNPLIYLYPKALELTHEYLADAAAVGSPSISSPTDYTRLLARQATQLWRPALLTHAFTTPHTLNRIAMLQRHSLPNAWRKWAFLPVAGALLGLVACEQLEAFGPPPPPPPPPVPFHSPNASATVAADKMPEYPGGTAQLMQDISRRLQYPAVARAAKFEGRIVLNFLVRTDGTIQDLHVTHAPDCRQDQVAAAESLVKAATDVVSQLPGMNKWQPAEAAGKPVAAEMAIPITFAL